MRAFCLLILISSFLLSCKEDVPPIPELTCDDHFNLIPEKLKECTSLNKQAFFIDTDSIKNYLLEPNWGNFNGAPLEISRTFKLCPNSNWEPIGVVRTVNRSPYGFSGRITIDIYESLIFKDSNSVIIKEYPLTDRFSPAYSKYNGVDSTDFGRRSQYFTSTNYYPTRCQFDFISESTAVGAETVELKLTVTINPEHRGNLPSYQEHYLRDNRLAAFFLVLYQ